jgi:Family of unknown function (DUF6492)
MPAIQRDDAFHAVTKLELIMSGAVGFFCKSYDQDFAPLAQLLRTFAAHNPENLLLTLSLPERHIPGFGETFGTNIANVSVVADESYCELDLSNMAGWHAQQVCKLMSWRTLAAEHYAVLDSDCYFVRDVRSVDIRPNAAKKYVACASFIRTVLKADNLDLIRYLQGDLVPDSSHLPTVPTAVADRLDEYLPFKDLPQDNPDAIARSSIPMKAFGREKDRWLFTQPGQFFSAGLLKRLCALFAVHGLTVGDAIRICPWEYNWYGEYAASHGFADVEFRVSPYLHFQDAASLAFAREQGITEQDIARRFLFVQMAARHLPELRFQ